MSFASNFSVILLYAVISCLSVLQVNSELKFQSPVDVSVRSSTSESRLNISKPRSFSPFPLTWGKPVTNKENSSDLSFNDGLVLVAVNEITGQIILRKVFPTWNAFSFSSDLLWWLERIQNGRLLLMFIHKSGTYGLKRALPYINSLGSLFAGFLPPHSLWIWVGVVGGKTVAEVATPVITKRFVKHLWTDIIFNLLNSTRHHFESVEKLLLWEFCEGVEGMGDTCSFDSTPLPNKRSASTNISKNNQHTKLYEEKPRPPNFKNQRINSTTAKAEIANQIGIVLCAGSRYQYLNQVLKSLFQCPEFNRQNLFIVVGVNFWTRKPDPQTINFLNILGLPYRVVLQRTTSYKTTEVKYFNFIYYREAWSAGLSAFPNKNFLAFLDEDVTVQKDWMKLLLHTAPLLKMDPSLWCITGSASNSLGKFSNDLKRGWRQVGWGFLLLVEDVAKTVEIWPETVTYTTLFDSWLLKTISKDRECIFPSISHSHHFGIGLNIIPHLHERYFIDEPLSPGNTSNYTPITSLIKSNYERFVNDSIKNSKILEKDPCAPGFLEDLDNSSHYVFYFALSSLWDAPEWTFLSECIGTWPYSTHGMHKGTMQITLDVGQSLWVVGVPFSPYSIHKPVGHHVWAPGDDAFVDRHANFTSKFYELPQVSNRTFKHAQYELFH